jgi:ferrous-iron efflux pump FieF
VRAAFRPVIVVDVLATSGPVVVRQTGSTAIAADWMHYLTDAAVNLAVLAGLDVTRLTGWERDDLAFALAISGYTL